MKISFLPGFLIIIFAIAVSVNAVTANEDNKTQNSNQKKGNCTAFDIKGRNEAAPTRILTPIDTTIIPADFPAPPPGSEACGCHTFIKTVYYLSDLKKEVIFDYYRKALNAEEYFVRDVTRGNAPSLFVMQFAGDKAVGEIYVFEDKAGFGIKYVPKKPCNCPDKENKQDIK